DDDTTGEVVSLAISGTNVYAGGAFNISGATEVDSFAVWNGTSWSMVGGPADDSINAIIVTNNAIYIAGDFTTIDSVAANGVARWTNSHWEPLSTGVGGGTVDCLALTSSNLFVGGSFTTAGDTSAVNIARWNDVNWNTLTPGYGNVPVGATGTLLVDGTNVFAGGTFSTAGRTSATNIAIWNGSAWTNAGGGLSGIVVSTLAGNSTNLIAGGLFDFAGTLAVTNIARWNGTTWSNMANGFDDQVEAICIVGTNIYAGGLFTHSGTNAVQHVARWTGNDWLPMGEGLPGECFAITQYGTNLYASGGGLFSWDGQSWSAVQPAPDGTVFSMAVSGNNLYVAGLFQSVSNLSAANIARFDGTNWYALGNGISGYCAVAIGGTNVFVSGEFGAAGTNAANNVAKWTGADWIPLGGGVDGPAWTIAANATNVYVAGEFTYAGDNPSYRFGIWNDRQPNIWSLPSDQTVSTGTNLTLSANVAGVQPITYQWFLNGAAIAGATNSTFAKTNVQSTDMGNYTLLVSNVYGAVLSDPTSVQLDSVVVFADNFESGSISNWTTVSGATALKISTNQSHSGTYSAIATNSAAKMFRSFGAEIEGHSLATFWIYDDQGAQTRWFGDVRNYSGGGFASGSLQQQLAIGLYATNFGTTTGDLIGEALDTNSYQGQIFAGDSTGYFNLNDSPFQRTNGWHKFQIERQDDPTTIDYWIDDNVYREISGAAGTTWDSTTIGSMGSGTNGGNVWFDDVKIEYLDPPDILTNPASQTVDAGANVTFKVVATGNIRSFQWLKNGALIAGATKSTFTVTNAQQEATYNVLVANGIGVSESDDATLTLNDKPTILVQPQSRTVPAGASFALSVSATGSPSNLAYQWRKNGIAVNSATTSDFVFLDCTNTSAGTYTVVITNIAGAITSAVAVVTITNSLPIITSQPTSATINLGANATFFVASSGSQPRTYRWRFNGANIAGATNSFYRRAAVQAADAGSYSVVVSNSFAAVTSSNVTLALNFPPVITTQPTSQTIAAGDTGVFNLQATGTAPLTYQWYVQFAGQSSGFLPLFGYDTSTNVFFQPTTDVSYAGTYKVMVYNMAGHVFSSNVTLVVNGPPVILDQPQDITVSPGSNAVFTVNAVGPALTYQWIRNGALIAGATNSTYVRTNVQVADVGIYTVTIANSYGSVVSDGANLLLDAISVFFDNFEAGLGNWTTLAGGATLSNSTTRKHSGTNSALCSSSSGKMFHNLPFAVQGHARLTFWAYDNGGALSNWFGEVRSYVGSTNGQPGQTFGSGVFTYPFVNETGDWVGLTPDTNFYQGFVLSGQTTGYFNLTDSFSTPPRTNGWHQFVIERQADAPSVDYFVDSNYIGTVTYSTPADWDSVVIGSAGSGNTNGSVWFDDIKVEYLDPPVIVGHPTDVHVHPGEGATFTVAAAGNVTGYQWLFNGNAIANATNSSYTIVSSQTNNAGWYSAIAINGIGGTLSNSGLLTVVPYPPTFSAAATTNNYLHLTVDRNSTIYSSTNLIDWVAMATNVSVLDVPFTNKAQFFKAGVPTFP
ncbi:MAG: beta strand repeat-containing protein, partial [Limisphaerales bacterium]